MGCDFDHPHSGHPCGRRVINGVTRCSVCGSLDGSPECEAAGCWQPATQRDLDELICEAMELAGREGRPGEEVSGSDA